MSTAPSAAGHGQRKYLYVYDLPRNKTTSVKLAEIFKEKQGVQIMTKPQIQRDLFRPFYQAIIPIENDEDMLKAKEFLKYFEVDGCPVRSLVFDASLKRDNKQKINQQNIFYKFPKDQNPDTITYESLSAKFSTFGPIKSIKIAMNANYQKKGFAYICFENEADASKCLATLSKTEPENVKRFEPKENKEGLHSNNLYFKNVPKDMPESEIRKIFDDAGKITSFKLMSNDIGQFGFACYENAITPKMIEQLSQREFSDKDGNKIKLYVKEFLNKERREQEKLHDMIRYKNSKKRCNLYVKNFPNNWTEEDIKSHFSQFGDIERIKLEKGVGRNIYAFVCFKMPDSASKAKAALHGQTVDGKGLVINHYEIKEIRDLQLEEIRDKRDWEKYMQMIQGGGAFAWSQLSNQPNLSHIIQQLLSLMQQQQHADMRSGPKRYPPNQQRRINQRPNQQFGNQQQMMPQQPMQQTPHQGVPQ
jgi:polyadenylate-binding protein